MQQTRDPYRAGRWLVFAFVGLVVTFLVVPLFVVVPVSFSDSSLLQFPPRGFSMRWYTEYLESPAWLAATVNSLQVGIIVALLSAVLGTLSALGITRARFPGRAALQAFLLSPLIIPVIVLAVGLYYAFSFLKLNGTLAGLVLGHSLLTIPYATVVITASLERFDVNLERVAISLGANHWRAFWRITFPIVRPGIIVATLFAFLMSFDEVVIAIFVTGPETTTIPRKMWDGIRYELDPTIASVATLLVLFSWLVLAIAEGLRRWLARNTG